MSQFYLASPSSSPSRRSSPHSDTDTPASLRPSRSRGTYNLPSTYSSEDDDDLPYPQPLDRTSFLSNDFDPTTYLSTLRNRHQTLADLRTELQSRVSSLQTELLDLVNDEYASFLGLGKDLKGGEERVESVRVGIMGFVKGVEGVRGVVTERRLEVERLIRQRREVVREKEVAVGLLGVWEGIGALERGLGISEREKNGGRKDNGAADTKASRREQKVDDFDSDEESADEESDLDIDDDLQDEDGGDDDAADTFHTSTTGTMSINKLQRLVRSYAGLRRTIHNLGPEHPFLQTQQPRLETIRATLLLDLGAALKAASTAIGPIDVNQQRLLKIVGLYGEMDEGKAGIQVLKSLKSQ